MRFEKAQDPENTVRALARAIGLMREVCPGARLVGGLADWKRETPAPPRIRLELNWLARKLGRPIPTSEVREILERLGFGVAETGDAFEVTVPSWRATKDVSIADDDHDSKIVAQVRNSRRAVAAAATHLGAMEERQQRLTTQVVIDRDRIQRARVALVSQEIVAARTRDAAAGRLASARQSVGVLRGQLARLQAAQAAQAAHAASAAPTSGGSTASGSGPAGGSSVNGGSGSHGSLSTSSSGGFTFPLPKSAVAPPGTWSLDDGVDMAAPGGTPEYAVCSGTIVLHGIGGFGPSAPVVHCDASLDGYRYVYYGHAGPGNWTAVGTHVSAGQTISEIGSGIVGISTGPHVEMGFADSSGSPIGPSSAATMSALLHAAYNG